MIEFFGDWKLTDIDEKLVDAFKEERRNAGLKRVSINNELRVLRRILGFARDERGIQLRPLKIQFMAVGTKRPKVWTEEEVKSLFTACDRLSPEILPILVFLANTGCRCGEALALSWDHVDLERGHVMIWPSEGKANEGSNGDDKPDEGWEPKNKKPREVPISADLLPWLDGDRTSEVWVFPCMTTGKRWAFWPQKKFQLVQKAAGLKGGVHTLRHTFASHFLRAQPDMFLLAQILGHSQTRVTELYSHLLPDHLERGRNAVSIAPAIGPATLKARLKWRTDPQRAERAPRQRRVRRNIR
ncbi:MAG: site-specific integrase [Deltaproteobacteria bacterium]|nr:site-specific integrase [Deltaproteobacteria bacterium]